MAKIEKKFRVESFDDVKQRLVEIGAKSAGRSISIHHYAETDGDTINKIVEDEDGVRITVLKDHGGTFEFVKREPVESFEEGMKWMKDQGFTEFKKLKMETDLYTYKNGTIELNTINDGQILSVILFYEPLEHEAITNELELNYAEKIIVAYNELV